MAISPSMKFILFAGSLLVLMAATPLAGAPSVCTGDCTNDGVVAGDDLVTLVVIALAAAPLSDCSAGNPNRDNRITVDEVLGVIGNPSNGCVAATATPTPTPPPGQDGCCDGYFTVTPGSLMRFECSQGSQEQCAALAGTWHSTKECVGVKGGTLCAERQAPTNTVPPTAAPTQTLTPSVTPTATVTRTPRFITGCCDQFTKGGLPPSIMCLPTAQQLCEDTYGGVWNPLLGCSITEGCIPPTPTRTATSAPTPTPTRTPSSTPTPKGSPTPTGTPFACCDTSVSGGVATCTDTASQEQCLALAGTFHPGTHCVTSSGVGTCVSNNKR